MKIALITPFLSHLPLHPSACLGYGAAILGEKFELDVIDLNAHIYFKNRDKLNEMLSKIEKKNVVMDSSDVLPFYYGLSRTLGRELDKISWKEYEKIFITTPSWFVTVPTKDILDLSEHIKAEAENAEISFFGNSLGSWTDENILMKNHIQIRHLNDLFHLNCRKQPTDYDDLPTPVYENREKYVFDMLPFRLKHGCIWGKCKFCSLAKGWNSGYLERSIKHVIQEMEELIDQYSPKMLVCRDNSINGSNLLEFSARFEKFKTPWVGMARADLSVREITALKRSGCKFIYFGLESGSDRVLKKINKGIDSKQMSRFIRDLHNQDIMPAPSLIVGTPDETEDDFKKTVHFILDHRNQLDVINLYPFMITPGSDLSFTEKGPNDNALIRLGILIKVCKDVGIKVCVGTQNAEYTLFKRVYPDHDHNRKHLAT